MPARAEYDEQVELMLFILVFRDFGCKKNFIRKALRISNICSNCAADNDENTKKWQFSSVQKIKDAYPKYLLSTDFDSANIDGIRKINVIEWLLK